jgi:alanine transaminase
VRQRARDILANTKGGTGAYSESKGVAFLRKMVAAGIEKRDGHPCEIEDLWLTDGASVGCHYLMKTLIRDKNDAVLVPIPQYPLYSATLALYGGTLLPYYLDESNNWALDCDELKRACDAARAEGKNVRALVVINPGNPTGAALDLTNQEEVVKFCEKENLLLIADEVYQENVYAEGKKFTSFKKVMRDTKAKIALASLQSTSKGFYGECGRRGGYMELNGFDEEVKDQLYKLSSVGLCPNLPGQIIMGLVMQPPQEGDVSYPLYAKERDDILASLKRRAVTLVDGLNALEGVQCNPAQGAMYAFPKITLPQKHIDEASSSGMAPDALYCMKLLTKTGIVVVPGSGFGQSPDTWHFRTTFLPAEADISDVVLKMAKFHAEFMDANR